ncbi:Uncharacterised protein [uncultured archaeon]|nr:Uncharacterised protein [uncultured archaeon]
MGLTFWKLVAAVGTKYQVASHEMRAGFAGLIFSSIKCESAKRALCFHKVYKRWKYSMNLKAIPPVIIARDIVNAIMPPARFQPSSLPRTAIVAAHGI